MSKEIIFCERCKEEIKRGTKAAGMHTYNEFPQVSDERYFHFDCFLEWRNESIIAAGKSAGNKAMKNVMPMIKPMIEKAIHTAKNYNEETDESNIQKYWTS